MGSTLRRFTQLYVQPLWTANSEEQAVSLTVSAQGAGTNRIVHLSVRGGRGVTHPRLQGTVFTVPGGYRV